MAVRQALRVEGLIVTTEGSGVAGGPYKVRAVPGCLVVDALDVLPQVAGARL